MKKLIKKQILIYLINMIIIICYYFFIYKYILNINNEVVTITTSTITVENLKLSEVPNIWYKSIIDDFFNKFTINSKTIDQKYFTIKNMQSFAIIKHHQDIIEKSILDTIRSDHINSLVLECESYKNKISNLEIQAYYTKMIHNSLINDLNEILKDVEKWRK
jgi:hypothetical protein